MDRQSLEPFLSAAGINSLVAGYSHEIVTGTTPFQNICVVVCVVTGQYQPRQQRFGSREEYKASVTCASLDYIFNVSQYSWIIRSLLLAKYGSLHTSERGSSPRSHIVLLQWQMGCLEANSRNLA
jgi:hypothetical protein